MPSPYLRQFFPHPPKDGQPERFLDNQYQIEMSAEDAAQILDYLAFAHKTQQDAAVAALRGLIDYGGPTDPLSAVLSLLTRPASPVGEGGFVPVDTVQRDLARRAEAMITHREMLEEIAGARRQAQEAETGAELLDEAQRALRSGMTSTGRDQQEEFKDALRLLRTTQQGSIGGRNYVTWFQVGWLQWKYEKDLPGAEEAFYQAYRLSASQSDLYHLYGLRHRAYLESLLEKHTDALESSARALREFPEDQDARFDAARYAARAGREDEALEHLEICLRREPSLARTLFSEPDFAPIANAVARLVLAATERASGEAQKALAHLGTTLAKVHEAETLSGVSISLPADLTAAADAARHADTRLAGADLAVATGFEEAARTLATRIADAARAALSAEAARTEESLQRPRRRIERLNTDKKHWESTLAALRREAKAGNYSLESAPKRGLFGRRDPRQEMAYGNYRTCMDHLEVTDAAIRTEMPALQAAVAEGEAQQARIREALDILAA
jgi:hypothetical protein